jgi:hypothetical protein
MAYEIEGQQLHQQAVTTLVSCGSGVISLGETCQAEFAGPRKTVVIFVEISAQGSVGHPWRYDSRYWTKPVGNPAQGNNVSMVQWLPFAEVVH